MRGVRAWSANAFAVAVLTVAFGVSVLAPSPEPIRHDGFVGWHDEDTGESVSAAYNPDGPEGTVYRLYRAYFLRDPDAVGFTYWLTQYRSGYPLESVSNDFARSTEFVRTYGALSDRQFVDRVYLNVLGRQPDQGGYDYWLRQMAAGLRRGVLMVAFSDSPEFRDKTATTVSPVPLPEAPDDPRAFTILRLDDNGEPIRWNPCRPVRVVANFTSAPPGTEPILRAAVQRVAEATGVEWSYVGRTTERALDPVASNLKLAFSPDREVVVSWPPSWDSPAAGMGGAGWRRSSATGETWFAFGSVQINPKMRFTETQMHHLLLHELGHVAGLGHPSHSYQVMSQGGRLQLEGFRAGDRSGMTVVGRNTTSC